MVIVPETSREPLLLNRAAKRGDRQEMTFICVPLVVNKKVVGALSVDLVFRRDRDYDRSLKFYKLVGSMIAQGIKVSRLAEAERRRLVEENTHLKDELRDRFAFQHLIGTSAPIRQVYDQVGQVAKTCSAAAVLSALLQEWAFHALPAAAAMLTTAQVPVTPSARPGSTMITSTAPESMSVRKCAWCQPFSPVQMRVPTASCRRW